MAELNARHRTLLIRLAVGLLITVLILSLQGALFYSRYAPRFEAANEQLFGLVVETAQRSILGDLGADFDALGAGVRNTTDMERPPAMAWRDFADHYAAAPTEAVAALQDELPVITAGIAADETIVERVSANLARLRELHVDRYDDLVDELRSPPLYLWPTASVLAGTSGYREAAVFNRALYLAQTGDIGTARVLLAGLNARVDEAEALGRIYYVLGRLQFQLFLETPEVEYYGQALQYLQSSLEAYPDGQLPRRLLDFLLSLPATATAPQSAEGRPETPSEGEGAAVSAEKRVF